MSEWIPIEKSFTRQKSNEFHLGLKINKGNKKTIYISRRTQDFLGYPDNRKICVYINQDKTRVRLERAGSENTNSDIVFSVTKVAFSSVNLSKFLLPYYKYIGTEVNGGVEFDLTKPIKR